MKINRKFAVTITIDTEKANTNSNKFGTDYDINAYPNWNTNYAGCESQYIENRINEFRNNFKFTGMKCKIKELK
jgi:hypothetical protein